MSPRHGTTFRNLLGRRGLAALILFAWGGTLGWLIRRHYVDRHQVEGASRWPVGPGSAFLAVRLGDRQVGIASITVDTLPDGYRVSDLLTIDLPHREGVARREAIRTEAFYTRELRLRSWRADLLTEGGRLATAGTVSGDTLLAVRLAQPGEPVDSIRLPLRRPVILPSAIALVAASRGPSPPGSHLNLEVFDPNAFQLRTAKLTIAAESLFLMPDSAEWDQVQGRWRVAHADTVRAWRLEGEEQGLPVVRWIDRGGLPVREEHPLGATVERSAFELVNTEYRSRPAAAWDSSVATPRYGITPSAPEVRRAAVIRLRLADGSPAPTDLPALQGGWQRRLGDAVRLGPGAGGEMGDSLEQGDAIADPLLAADAALRSQALTLARRAPAGPLFAAVAAAWVRQAVGRREGVGMRPATSVLTRLEGTAQERTRLLVALARANGHPAREVWGLALVAGRWELRPWAELWSGEWIPMDPNAPGTTPSAARLRLGINAPARLLDLVIRGGQVRLDILEERR